jgi:hypothetical protein
MNDILKKIQESKSDINEEEFQLIKAIVEAKKEAKPQALLSKAIGGNKENKQTIHHFPNLDKCICKCHDSNKIDCEECYDHPTHLKI